MKKTAETADGLRNEKERALEAAISQLEKEFGKGAVMKLGEANEAMNIEAVPTGSLSLDIALGVGGVPKGRIIEIYGPESSGKTTERSTSSWLTLSRPSRRRRRSTATWATPTWDFRRD